MDLLIEEVKKHPALYDHRDDNFHDKLHKNNIWAQIANTLKYPSSSEAEKDWTELVNKFTNTVEKQISIKMGIDDPRGRKWKYAQSMSFMLPFIKTKTEPDENTTTSSDVDTIAKHQPANTTSEAQSVEDERIPGDSTIKIKKEINVDNIKQEIETEENEPMIAENIKKEIDIEETEPMITEFIHAEVKTEETQLTISEIMPSTIGDESNTSSTYENDESEIIPTAAKGATYASLLHKNSESSFDDDDDEDEDEDYDEELDSDEEDVGAQVEPVKRDSLYHFFMSMYTTTTKMPEILQKRIQNKISDALAETDEIMQNSGLPKNV